MVEGIEKCKFIGRGRGVRRTTSTTAPVTARTSTITTTSTTEETLQIFHEQQTDDEEDDDHTDDDSAVGCEHEDRSGIVRVGVTKLNGGGRDYHTRLCDQETSGGGWTVGSMSSSLMFTVCMTYHIFA